MDDSKSENRPVRLLAIAGSMRKESFNRKLLAVAVRAAEDSGAAVDVVEPRDLELPLYDGDLEAEHGVPESVQRLKARIAGADGLLIASPEYNHSIPGAFKNAIDWTSRGPDKVYPGKTAALLGAAPGGFGAMRALLHLRQVLTALGVWMVPAQVTVPRAGDAFDEGGALKEAATLEQVEGLVKSLLERIGRDGSGAG